MTGRSDRERKRAAMVAMRAKVEARRQTMNKAAEYEKLALTAERKGNYGMAGDMFKLAADESKDDAGQRSWYQRRAAAAYESARYAATTTTTTRP